MMKKITKTMVIRNVAYVDRPNAIRKFILAGFSINDIVVTRIDYGHYDMIATLGGV